MRIYKDQSDLDQITDLVKGMSDILTYKNLRFTVHFFHRYAERTGRVPETLFDVHQIVTDLVDNADMPNAYRYRHTSGIQWRVPSQGLVFVVDLATKTVVTIWIPET